ncbi:hypothetical protein NQ176_g6697 [Zarea fungicola]|uniref:Uncharacterized protein n=1 Tax=Zarea fungicola TaxID=93591 RepID=A0ACC1N3R8_9HYPO|nr:hypothetical protein NQ176_g6697 [Lecanicillium fungicola]
MRTSSFLPFIPVLVASQVVIPDDAVEGFAIHLSDDSGQKIYVPESEFDKYGISMAVNDTYANGANGANGANSTSLNTRGDQLFCDASNHFWIEDLHTNLIEFADYMSCGREVSVNPSAPWKYEAASFYIGTTVIYICNYSRNTFLVGAYDLFANVYRVFNDCGQNNIAGWILQGSTQLSIGYTNSNTGFCGPRN